MQAPVLMYKNLSSLLWPYCAYITWPDYHMASTNCGRTDDASPMAANFASGVGPCVGIIEPFKHILRVTAHPQILALGL